MENDKHTILERRRSDEAIKLIHDDLQNIKSELKTVTEILVAWNNAKGFVRTIKFIGDIVKWGAPIVAALAAMWYFFIKDR